MSIEERNFSIFVFSYLSIKQVPYWQAKMETKVPRAGQSKTQQRTIVLAKDVYLNSVQLRLQAYWLTPQKIFWQITSRTQDGLKEDPSVTLKLIAIYGNALSPLNHPMVSLRASVLKSENLTSSIFAFCISFIKIGQQDQSGWLEEVWKKDVIHKNFWKKLLYVDFFCIIYKRTDCTLRVKNNLFGKPKTKTAEQRIRFY